MEKEQSIIIYDSDCTLCQKAVKFLKTKEGPLTFDFITSSGSQSDELLQVHQIPKELTSKSVILIDNGRVYTKSTAVIKAMQRKEGIWRFAVVFMVIPAFIRNLVYDWVAGSRKKK